MFIQLSHTCKEYLIYSLPWFILFFGQKIFYDVLLTNDVIISLSLQKTSKICIKKYLICEQGCHATTHLSTVTQMQLRPEHNKYELGVQVHLSDVSNITRFLL